MSQGLSVDFVQLHALKLGYIVSAVFGAPPDRVRPYLFGWNLRAGG